MPVGQCCPYGAFGGGGSCSIIQNPPYCPNTCPIPSGRSPCYYGGSSGNVFSALGNALRSGFNALTGYGTNPPYPGGTSFNASQLNAPTSFGQWWASLTPTEQMLIVGGSIGAVLLMAAKKKGR